MASNLWQESNGTHKLRISFIVVCRPDLFRLYNKYMGGTDRMKDNFSLTQKVAMTCFDIIDRCKIMFIKKRTISGKRTECHILKIN